MASVSSTQSQFGLTRHAFRFPSSGSSEVGKLGDLPTGVASLKTVEPTVELNGVQYLLVDTGIPDFTDQTKLQEIVGAFTIYPVNPGDKISGSSLAHFRENCLDSDDIFQPLFLRHVVFFGSPKSEVHLQPCAVDVLKAWHAEEWSFETASRYQLAPGPYVSCFGKVWQPWRMYADNYLTMTSTCKPKFSAAQEGQDHNAPSELDGSFARTQARVVVPSRCYSKKKPPEKPLLGWRIAVKDIFDIEGFQTTLCNRAWAEYHGVKSKTAPSVKHLQDLGACIVGKTRLNAMLVREETMECVEFLAPFNPRGDGFQTSSGSSSGSCAALGAYPWLDFAIGSDTNGSCRKPAYWNGCYAVRPTHGVLDTSGVTSFCPFYDVPTFFGRDLSVFHKFAELWYGDSTTLVKSASLTESPTILYPTDYLPTGNDEQMKVIETFVSDLESFLGVRRTAMSLADKWQESCPESVKIVNLSEFLKTAGTMPYYKDAIGLVKQFTEGYKEKNGKAPFIHRALRWRWEMADKLTPEERDEGWERIYTYRAWLLEYIFKKGTIVVLPIDEGRPNYRDAPPPPFGLLSGYSPLYLSPIAGAPEITLPIGEISYHSEITMREEPLPISISVVSPPGTDLALIDLIHDTLVHAEKPVKVKTGRFTFRD